MRGTGCYRGVRVGICGRYLCFFAIECEDEGSVGKSDFAYKVSEDNLPLCDDKVLFLMPMPMVGWAQNFSLSLCDFERIWICLDLQDTVSGAGSKPFGSSGTVTTD